jgi:hypothetical protein
MNPYTENITNNESIVERLFEESCTQDDLLWHRDPEDRRLLAIEKTDWLIQLDNELPVSLNTEVFIPKETYHRLIKGNDDLKIIVKKQI